MNEGLIVILFIGAMIALAIIGYIADQRRTDAVKQLADTMGFSYLEDSSSYLPDTIWQFDLFNKGRRRKVRNLIQGNLDAGNVAIGDYQYTTGSGKHKHTYRQTVVFIESDQLHLPSFLLSPENIFHKIGDLFGYYDIDFDAYPEFSTRYLLRGSNERAIRQQFHDGVLSFYQRRPGMSSEGIGRILIYYKQNQCLPPKDWKSLLHEALEACDQFSCQHTPRI